MARHAPPSIAALASSPGGSVTVRSLGESPELGANFRSMPRLVVEPADVPCWVSVRLGEIVADAAGARHAKRIPVASIDVRIRRPCLTNS